MNHGQKASTGPHKTKVDCSHCDTQFLSGTSGSSDEQDGGLAVPTLAAIDAQGLYAEPSHKVCSISGDRQI
jgi:hypothetical protein